MEQLQVQNIKLHVNQALPSSDSSQDFKFMDLVGIP